MSISIPAGIHRDVAEQFGRYFETRRIQFTVRPDETGGLIFSFGESGRETPVVVSFKPGLLDEIQGLGIHEQRLALANMYGTFSEALNQRGTGDAELAGVLRIERFR
jgi:hypothetical protein